jgi:2'-5' RNA ligase
MSDNLQTGDYRIFVGAFPTGDLAERIQALRQRHDARTARITAPHVTLAGTYWHSGPATSENEVDTIACLQAARNQIQPFELVLGGVRSFLPRNSVIYLHIERTDGLLTARRTLLEALGPDKHRRFVPHLTLTMRLSIRETRSLLARLQQSEWHTRRWSVLIDYLWLMQRGPGEPEWRYIHRVDLAGASSER